MRRLSDAALATVVTALVKACHARPLCAKLLPQREQPPAPLATDVVLGGGGQWQLLFGTPFYSTTLQNHPNLNRDLIKILDKEADAQAQKSRGSFEQRSLVGTGWRTDDSFLQRKTPAVVRLNKMLLEHAGKVAQFGQPRKLNLELHLSGWAVSLDVGGWMREHVHPLASWSGVYYIAVGDEDEEDGSSSKDRTGGCLRLSDPRPGSQMVTLGPNDHQFMESRTVCPRAGLLVLFPAWLSHSVTPLFESVGADPEAGQKQEAEEVGVDAYGRSSGRASTGARGALGRRLAVAFNVHGAEVELVK